MVSVSGSSINLVVQQGVDVDQSITFNTSVTLSATAPRTTAPGPIFTYPTSTAIVANTRLVFNRDLQGRIIDPPIILVVATDTVAGATEIPVTGVPREIPRHAMATSTPLDLTAYSQMTGQYRAIGPTGLVTGSISISAPSPTSGTIRLLIPSAQTRLIVPNVADPSVLPMTDLQNRKKFPADLYGAAYLWEVEWMNGSGLKERPVSYGRMFVTAEAVMS